MSDTGLTLAFVAFAVAWLAVGAYVVRLALAHRDVEARLRRLESTDAPAVPRPSE